MNVRLATTDSEIAACYPVIHELRPHLAAEELVARIRRQERDGYRLAFVAKAGAPVAVAGFRIGENLAWGRFLYVDDLVTLATCRSQGYGAGLLSWLRDYSARAGCRQFHLDSGLQRQDAHRFYEREGMTKSSYHFVATIGPDSKP